MHVTGAWGHARDTGSRDKLAIGATGHVRNTGRRNRAAIGAERHAGRGGRRQMAGLGGWRRVAGWAGWRRLARELVLVAVFLAVYEEIGWHMVQAGGPGGRPALWGVLGARGPLVCDDT